MMFRGSIVEKPRASRELSRMGHERKGTVDSRPETPPLSAGEVIEHRPAECRHCGLSLDGAPEVGRPSVHQVVELPKIRAEVTEHRAPRLSCPQCGKRTRGQIPRAVTSSHFGPQLVAMGAMLTSRFRLSRRDLEAFCTDLLDVPAPSLGTTQAFADEAAAALLPAYREVRRAVRRSKHAGVDETGWK